MPLTILHISTRLILGGSQENTVLSCEGQANNGHDVHLAFGPIYGPEGSHLDRVSAFRTDDGRGITSHELPNMVREIHPVKDHFCFHNDLKKLMRDVKPDVVHTHSSKAGILGRWAAWSARLPNGHRPAVIHTIHGPPFMPIEGGVGKRAAVRTKNAIYTAAESFAAKRCHLILSVADAMTEQFLDRGIGRPEQYLTVRSGLETEPFITAGPGDDRASVRRELGFEDDDFVIGTVARLAEHKGHDDLLDALGDELKVRPNWKLLWVGDGWWRDRLLGRVREMGLTDRVITTGLVPNAQVPRFMRAMDVLAHPSYREGLPRTVPQALLTGVPSVAHDVDGTKEICIDAVANKENGTGRLVSPGDHPGLREAVLWMFDHPEERAGLGARGRDLVLQDFSARRMVEHLEEVYAQAIDMARRA
ncbi:MAG: glycosyltransferase family 4 protein [Planctomycetota bacterium]